MERTILVERKELVKRLSELTGEKSRYLGTPSCAYEIGCFKVTKEGKLVFEEYTDTIQTVESEGFIETETDTEKLEESGLSISMPRTKLDDNAVANLKALVESKGELLKHAFCVEELPMEIDEEKVTFNWFKLTDSDHTQSYTAFIQAICEMAVKQGRISSKPGKFVNEKYAFRCFLLRLGFIGDEYKKERKILLENLTGSAAFKDGKKEAQE